MKMSNCWTRLSLSLTLLLGYVLNASAWWDASPEYYAFKTTLSVSPTGAGEVYATYTSYDFVGDHTMDESKTTDTKSYEAVIYSKNNTITLNLHAEAKDGYRFVKWQDESGNQISGGSAPSVSLAYTNGTAQRKRDIIRYEYLGLIRIPIYGDPYYTGFQDFQYKAIFREAGSLIVKVADSDKDVGSAYIKEESYQEGDEVTLVASTAGGSELVGWAFDYWELNGVKVSESEELKVTVPQEKVTYIAHFIKASAEYYCFIKNKETGRYLKLSKVIDKFTWNATNDDFTSNFDGSLTLVDENATTPPISDPGCVFIVSGFEADANGVKNATLISQAVPIGNTANSKIIKGSINLSPVSSGVFTISTMSGDYKCYFRDNGGTFDVHPVISDASLWEIVTLNNANIDKHYFGVTPNTRLCRDDFYYTTLYTTFPYQLIGDGMKAYYVDDNSVVENGDSYRVVCKEIEENIVPAWFPVIIECKGETAVDNKILPLMPANLRPESLYGVVNCLSGHIKVQNNGQDKTGNGRMFVLSVGNNTGLGLYKLKQGTSMTDNKVYAELNPESISAKDISFAFGEDAINGIATDVQDEVLPKSLTGAVVYDLQGRQVKNPTQGVYIVNGKKFIIK